MKNFIYFFLLTTSISATYAQIGINTDGSAPHSSAVLDVKSTTKAFYPPRMTTAEKEVIVGKQVGAVVFDITLNQLSVYNGTAWVAAGGSSFALPYSGTSNASNNLLYIENTAPISNFSTIYGKTNSSATTAGIYGLASSTGSTNNTAGVRGQNNSANSFGYGVEGIHTGGGAGGYFSSSTGAAIITGNGNVGIGTNTPILGGLVVNRKAGAVNALFGSNTTGVAIETDYPGIGLNTFYNNGRKMINTGFGGLIGLNPNTGAISVYNTATSIAGQGNTASLNERLTILANGNVGIGTTNPNEKFEVYGTAAFSGTTYTSHFNYDVNEHTFLRGGKTNSHVIINDLTGLGNVGIGTNNPLEKLHIIGGIRASTLAGTGTRPLYATSSGQITTAAPSLTYFYSIPSVAFSEDYNVGSRVNSDVQTYFNDASIHAIYAPINVPDGATITYIAIKYLDNSTNELSCSLLTNNLNGTAPTETVVGNTINAFQGTISVNNLSININNLFKSYLLRITGSWDGGNMRIFGAVIGYTY